MDKFIKYKASFRIGDEKLNPSEITKMLGIDPDIAHRKGDPNTAISKKGKLIEFAPFNTGLWSINSKEDEYDTLECHIKSLLLLLYPLKDKLLELSSRGYKMDIFCGIFTNEFYESGFGVRSSLLLQMGELNIELGVCIYT